MIKQAGHLAGTGQQNIALELGIPPLGHLLAKRCPRIRADGEDDKDLKGMKASVRRLVRVPGGEKCGQLDKAAALELGVIPGGHRFPVQEGVTRTNDRAGETDGRGHKRKLISRRQTSRQYPTEKKGQ
jgi:hypothetical protein